MDPDPSPYPLPPEPLPMDRPALLAALRARIGRLERAGAAAALARSQAGVVNLSETLDAHLPAGGLARAGLHEILAAEPGAAAGFAAVILGRTGGPVLWIGPEPDAWPPGLARYGLSPAELVLVRAPRPADGLWAMEEALRCPAVTGALLNLSELDITAARRLQLAAEAGGALGLLLRPDTEEAGPSAALTRWRVGALPGTGTGHSLGDPRWQLDLLRCRGGTSHAWTVTWRTTTDRLDTDTTTDSTPLATPTRRRRA
ncbi:ImuA family protein [Falsiroseomonas sp.]|uniref:ImuA family protein n=1 Tax=Falsiroseomonas sp. TaxID=2870721 RepID=UPI0035685550